LFKSEAHHGKKQNLQNRRSRQLESEAGWVSGRIVQVHTKDVDHKGLQPRTLDRRHSPDTPRPEPVFPSGVIFIEKVVTVYIRVYRRYSRALVHWLLDRSLAVLWAYLIYRRNQFRSGQASHSR
jgi:hypothetical protein